jgi:hypothetical protein
LTFKRLDFRFASEEDRIELHGRRDSERVSMNASRQALPFRLTPVLGKVLLQRIGPLRRAAPRAPSGVMAR